MTNTKGYTYFAIKTENEELGLDTFDKYLSIRPTQFQKMYEKGKIPVCTSWKYSSDDLTNPFFFEEIEKLIDKLEPHKEELIRLKTRYPEFKFVLVVVIFLGDESPGLNFSERTISFMNEVEGEIDCDIYNEK